MFVSVAWITDILKSLNIQRKKLKTYPSSKIFWKYLYVWPQSRAELSCRIWKSPLISSASPAKLISSRWCQIQTYYKHFFKETSLFLYFLLITNMFLAEMNSHIRSHIIIWMQKNGITNNSLEGAFSMTVANLRPEPQKKQTLSYKLLGNLSEKNFIINDIINNVMFKHPLLTYSTCKLLSWMVFMNWICTLRLDCMNDRKKEKFNLFEFLI